MKSQVTIFIILAIVIVAGLLIFFVIKINTNIKNINPEVEEVYNYVQGCIEKTTKEAVYHIGDTGGYFLIPNLSTGNERAYFFYENKNLMPSKEKIEKELSIYVNEMLFFCTKNFVEFESYDIEQGEINTTTLIEDEKIIFNVNYPLSIKKDNNSYILEKFFIEVQVRLGIIYNFIEEIMNIQLETPRDICISCIGDLATEKALQVSLQDYQENDVIFVVVDPFSEIDGEPYRFYFANKYENENQRFS